MSHEEDQEDNNKTQSSSTIPVHRRTWESTDCTSSKTVLVEGDLTSDKPRLGSTGEVTIRNIKLKDGGQEDVILGSKYFTDHSAVEFSLGLPEICVDRGFEKCLTGFLPGETSNLIFRILLEPGLNRKLQVQSKMSPVWVTVECEVTLVSLLNSLPIYSWYPETKLTKAKDAHQAGSILFKQSRYLDSFYLFQLAHKLAVFTVGVKKMKMTDKAAIEDKDDNSALLEDAKQLVVTCANNLAACHFQWGHYNSVVDLSTVVLRSQSQVKTLYRRGVSYMELGELELAQGDLIAAHKEDPTNRAVNEQLGRVKQKKRTAESQIAERMSKLFG